MIRAYAKSCARGGGARHVWFALTIFALTRFSFFRPQAKRHLTKLDVSPESALFITSDCPRFVLDAVGNEDVPGFSLAGEPETDSKNGGLLVVSGASKVKLKERFGEKERRNATSIVIRGGHDHCEVVLRVDTLRSLTINLLSENSSVTRSSCDEDDHPVADPKVALLHSSGPPFLPSQSPRTSFPRLMRKLIFRLLHLEVLERSHFSESAPLTFGDSSEDMMKPPSFGMFAGKLAGIQRKFAIFENLSITMRSGNVDLGCPSRDHRPPASAVLVKAASLSIKKGFLSAVLRSPANDEARVLLDTGAASVFLDIGEGADIHGSEAALKQLRVVSGALQASSTLSSGASTFDVFDSQTWPSAFAAANATLAGAAHRRRAATIRSRMANGMSTPATMTIVLGGRGPTVVRSTTPQLASIPTSLSSKGKSRSVLPERMLERMLYVGQEAEASLKLSAEAIDALRDLRKWTEDKRGSPWIANIVTHTFYEERPITSTYDLISNPVYLEGGKLLRLFSMGLLSPSRTSIFLPLSGAPNKFDTSELVPFKSYPFGDTYRLPTTPVSTGWERPVSKSPDDWAADIQDDVTSTVFQGITKELKLDDKADSRTFRNYRLVVRQSASPVSIRPGRHAFQDSGSRDDENALSFYPASQTYHRKSVDWIWLRAAAALTTVLAAGTSMILLPLIYKYAIAPLDRRHWLESMTASLVRLHVAERTSANCEPNVPRNWQIAAVLIEAPEPGVLVRWNQNETPDMGPEDTLEMTLLFTNRKMARGRTEEGKEEGDREGEEQGKEEICENATGPVRLAASQLSSISIFGGLHSVLFISSSFIARCALTCLSPSNGRDSASAAASANGQALERCEDVDVRFRLVWMSEKAGTGIDTENGACQRLSLVAESNNLSFYHNIVCGACPSGAPALRLPYFVDLLSESASLSRRESSFRHFMDTFCTSVPGRPQVRFSFSDLLVKLRSPAASISPPEDGIGSVVCQGPGPSNETTRYSLEIALAGQSLNETRLLNLAVPHLLSYARVPLGQAGAGGPATRELSLVAEKGFTLIRDRKSFSRLCVRVLVWDHVSLGISLAEGFVDLEDIWRFHLASQHGESPQGLGGSDYAHLNELKIPLQKPALADNEELRDRGAGTDAITAAQLTQKQGSQVAEMDGDACLGWCALSLVITPTVGAERLASSLGDPAEGFRPCCSRGDDDSGEYRVLPDSNESGAANNEASSPGQAARSTRKRGIFCEQWMPGEIVEEDDQVVVKWTVDDSEPVRDLYVALLDVTLQRLVQVLDAKSNEGTLVWTATRNFLTTTTGPLDDCYGCTDMFCSSRAFCLRFVLLDTNCYKLLKDTDIALFPRSVFCEAPGTNSFYVVQKPIPVQDLKLLYFEACCAMGWPVSFLDLSDFFIYGLSVVANSCTPEDAAIEGLAFRHRPEKPTVSGARSLSSGLFLLLRSRVRRAGLEQRILLLGEGAHVWRSARNLQRAALVYQILVDLPAFLAKRSLFLEESETGASRPSNQVSSERHYRSQYRQKLAAEVTLRKRSFSPFSSSSSFRRASRTLGRVKSSSHALHRTLRRFLPVYPHLIRLPEDWAEDVKAMPDVARMGGLSTLGSVATRGTGLVGWLRRQVERVVLGSVASPAVLGELLFLGEKSVALLALLSAPSLVAFEACRLLNGTFAAAVGRWPRQSLQSREADLFFTSVVFGTTLWILVGLWALWDTGRSGQGRHDFRISLHFLWRKGLLEIMVKANLYIICARLAVAFLWSLVALLINTDTYLPFAISLLCIGALGKRTHDDFSASRRLIRQFLDEKAAVIEQLAAEHLRGATSEPSLRNGGTIKWENYHSSSPESTEAHDIGSRLINALDRVCQDADSADNCPTRRLRGIVSECIAKALSESLSKQIGLLLLTELPTALVSTADSVDAFLAGVQEFLAPKYLQLVSEELLATLSFEKETLITSTSTECLIIIDRCILESAIPLKDLDCGRLKHAKQVFALTLTSQSWDKAFDQSSPLEKLALLFSFFDRDGDGVLNEVETAEWLRHAKVGMPANEGDYEFEAFCKVYLDFSSDHDGGSSIKKRLRISVGRLPENDATRRRGETRRRRVTSALSVTKNKALEKIVDGHFRSVVVPALESASSAVLKNAKQSFTVRVSESSECQALFDRSSSLLLQELHGANGDIPSLFGACPSIKFSIAPTQETADHKSDDGMVAMQGPLVSSPLLNIIGTLRTFRLREEEPSPGARPGHPLDKLFTELVKLDRARRAASQATETLSAVPMLPTSVARGNEGRIEGGLKDIVSDLKLMFGTKSLQIMRNSCVAAKYIEKFGKSGSLLSQLSLHPMTCCLTPIELRRAALLAHWLRCSEEDAAALAAVVSESAMFTVALCHALEKIEDICVDALERKWQAETSDRGICQVVKELFDVDRKRLTQEVLAPFVNRTSSEQPNAQDIGDDFAMVEAIKFSLPPDTLKNLNDFIQSESADGKRLLADRVAEETEPPQVSLDGTAVAYLKHLRFYFPQGIETSAPSVSRGRYFRRLWLWIAYLSTSALAGGNSMGARGPHDYEDKALREPIGRLKNKPAAIPDEISGLTCLRGSVILSLLELVCFLPSNILMQTHLSIPHDGEREELRSADGDDSPRHRSELPSGISSPTSSPSQAQSRRRVDLLIPVLSFRDHRANTEFYKLLHSVDGQRDKDRMDRGASTPARQWQACRSQVVWLIQNHVSFHNVLWIAGAMKFDLSPAFCTMARSAFADWTCHTFLAPASSITSCFEACTGQGLPLSVASEMWMKRGGEQSLTNDVIKTLVNAAEPSRAIFKEDFTKLLINIRDSSFHSSGRQATFKQDSAECLEATGAQGKLIKSFLPTLSFTLLRTRLDLPDGVAEALLALQEREKETLRQTRQCGKMNVRMEVRLLLRLLSGPVSLVDGSHMCRNLTQPLRPQAVAFFAGLMTPVLLRALLQCVQELHFHARRGLRGSLKREGETGTIARPVLNISRGDAVNLSTSAWRNASESDSPHGAWLKSILDLRVDLASDLAFLALDRLIGQGSNSTSSQMISAPIEQLAELMDRMKILSNKSALQEWQIVKRALA